MTSSEENYFRRQSQSLNTFQIVRPLKRSRDSAIAIFVSGQLCDVDK